MNCITTAFVFWMRVWKCCHTTIRMSRIFHNCKVYKIYYEAKAKKNIKINEEAGGRRHYRKKRINNPWTVPLCKQKAIYKEWVDSTRHALTKRTNWISNFPKNLSSDVSTYPQLKFPTNPLPLICQANAQHGQHATESLPRVKRAKPPSWPMTVRFWRDINITNLGGGKEFSCNPKNPMGNFHRNPQQNPQSIVVDV